MKLISVQSNENKLVRIVCDDEGFNHEVIEKTFGVRHPKLGFEYRAERIYCGSLDFAMERAERFLKSKRGW